MGGKTMEEIENKNKCGHPDCHCLSPISDEICSEYCRNANGEIRGICQCGHPECGMGITSDFE